MARSRQAARLSTLLAAIALCCLALGGSLVSEARQYFHSEIEPTISSGADRSQPVSHLFREWYFDTGSGGFPQHYHDEPRLADAWKQEPAENLPSKLSP
jgi:hypothetical protein